MLIKWLFIYKWYTHTGCIYLITIRNNAFLGDLKNDSILGLFLFYSEYFKKLFNKKRSPIAPYY